jgi:hypothetical protein
VGVVIGKKGENVKRIEQTYGIKIQIAPEPPADRPQERCITMNGHPDAISHAQTEIRQQIVRYLLELIVFWMPIFLASCLPMWVGFLLFMCLCVVSSHAG